jgi:Tir chaperone protein (CesT) family
MKATCFSNMSAEQDRPNDDSNRSNSPEKCTNRAHFTNPFRKGLGHVRRHSHHVRVGRDDEILKKNRRLFDNQFRRVGNLIGKDLSLNTEGMGYFSHGKFVVVVEVPADVSGEFFIYTLVCRVSPTDNMVLVLHKAMQLNYMECATRGSSLGIDDGEINLCYSGPIAALSVSKLQVILESFLLTATETNEQLDAAKNMRPRSI